MNVRVRDLFHEVADLTREERARYFDEYAVDEETRREVESLLRFDSGANGLTQDIGVAATRALEEIEGQGRRCGPYRLLRAIGRGGMGTVYLAERADGEVAQRVAVKLLPPGAGDRLRERFLQERQILAALTHPNIARMLDAGHLDNGQPFLAMEYVDGKPIDALTAGLGLRPRIEVFVKVCAAIAYLHRNLVVHRDLKPSNIMVTAEGEPKLLDFGIAKILDLATDTTITSMRMLTPDYASPEQVTGGPVSTATDIYSLGAVLYKLLTGKTPHEFEERSRDAIAASIVTRDVTRPSRWAPELKGDLESILLKALRKNPQERYGTVEQFAEDLEAVLDSKPVRARAGNAWYHARKFVRRYWVPVAAAAVVIASLSAGLYVANRERTLAQRRFLEVRQLANKLFDIDLQARQLPGSTKTRQLIVNTSLEYLERVAADVRGDPELALEVGNAYMRVARVQGVPISPNLGQMDQAEKTLRIAEGFIDSVLAAQPGNRTALLRSSQIAHDRMILARLTGDQNETLALARKAEAALDKFSPGIADKAEATAFLTVYMNVADQLRMDQQFDEALRLCERAGEAARAVNSQSYTGDFLWVTAKVLRDRGELDAALKSIQESVELLDPGPQKGMQGQTNNYTLALIYRGQILGEDNAISLDRPQDAIASLDQAFEIDDAFVHRDPVDQFSRGRLGMTGITLGDIVRHSNPRRALEIYDHTLRHLEEIKSNVSLQRYEVKVLAGSSYVLRRLGHPAEARQRLDAAFQRLSALSLYPAEKIRPGSEAAEALEALADHEGATGNAGRGIEVYEGLISRLESGGMKPATDLKDAVGLARIWGSLAALYRRTGQRNHAVALEERRVELWREWDRKIPNNAFVQRQIAAEDTGDKATGVTGVGAR